MLKKIGLVDTFYFENSIKDGAKDSKSPDAIVSLISDEKLALELELTQKSRKRYRNDFYSHIVSKEYSKVLYICEKQSNIRAIEKGASFYANDENKFQTYFILLEDLMNYKQHSVVYNKNREVLIKDLLIYSKDFLKSGD